MGFYTGWQVSTYTESILRCDMAWRCFLFWRHLLANFLPVAGQRLPFFFFFAAVALTARLCGFGPAVMATVLSGILANFFFLAALLFVRLWTECAVQVFLFVMVSLLITSVALQKSAAEMAAATSQTQLTETLRHHHGRFYFLQP